MVEKYHYSYNQLHKIIAHSAKDILAKFKPDIIVAIGGGGFIPARILRTFLRTDENSRNIPIYAVGLVLYDKDIDGEPLAGVTKTQWLTYNHGNNDGHISGGRHAQTGISLLGKRILIVDEVDDTRQTLKYAVDELLKDIEDEKQVANTLQDSQKSKEAEIGVFVLHNKLKTKAAELPVLVMKNYFSGEDVEDFWIVYPWEAQDIEEHTRLADSR